jgi:hypothetical protein
VLRAIHLQVGFELRYDCPQPVPMILLVNMHFSRAADIVVADRLTTDPVIPVTAYRDAFGNWCSRLIAPTGRLRLTANGVVRDTGQFEQAIPGAAQHSVEELPGKPWSSSSAAATAIPIFFLNRVAVIPIDASRVAACSGNLRLRPR